MVEFAVAVAAGGKSSRMGADKSFVLLGGKPLIGHVLARVSCLGQVETFVVADSPHDYAKLNLRLVADIQRDKGALGGIYSAIHHSPCDYTLAVACDMPFLSAALLRYMAALCVGPFDVVVPRVKGYPQGLHAFYSKACLGPIRERVEADQLKVIGFYESVRVRYLDEPEYAAYDPAGLSFHNINTPDELEQAERRLGDDPLAPEGK